LTSFTWSIFKLDIAIIKAVLKSENHDGAIITTSGHVAKQAPTQRRSF